MTSNICVSISLLTKISLFSTHVSSFLHSFQHFHGLYFSTFIQHGRGVMLWGCPGGVVDILWRCCDGLVAVSFLSSCCAFVVIPSRSSLPLFRFGLFFCPPGVIY